MARKLKLLVLMVFVLALGACEQRDHDGTLAKVKGLTTPEEVRTALGPADRISKTGTTEIWEYSTSAADVCFAAAGNAIIRLSSCL
ncbi:hypothetical protein [Sneathiella sp.]|uniref:hypothetical protein n=1 Tax=Sneathiella sp. TaxID=1964365 RepID=UPI003568F53E